MALPDRTLKANLLPVWLLGWKKHQLGAFLLHFEATLIYPQS
jgi:hypothetical protein